MKRQVTKFLLILLIAGLGLSSCRQVPSRKVMGLSDEAWYFHEKGSDKMLPAKVPGSVHMDLLANGEIPDPYYRDNEERLQWIGECDWVYQTKFTVKQELLKMDNLELVFKGLDTYADVYLNEKEVLNADNFFRVWRVAAKSLLREGKNTLEVRFTSPVKMDKQKQEQDLVPLEYLYAYTRKPAYHFGWDWGPVYITQGIWQPVELEAWNDARLRNVRIYQNNLSDEKADLTLLYEVEADKDVEVELTATCVNTGQTDKNVFQLKKGMNTAGLFFTIENPKRWWTNGLGEPYLYTFKTEMKISGKVVDALSERTGLRTIKVVQEPDSLGKSFYVELNGVPVFMKGANYIPQDMFLNRPTEETYKATIKNAVEANMNMLRVWGGGFYEKDIFYDLCDENGLLVWQDFMFACAMYPGDDDFLNNVKEEAVQNVKRLRNHPCIALWCGNNENYIGWLNWGWPKQYSKPDSAKVWRDYVKLFEEMLPDVVEKYDPDRFYWPSSPSTNWGQPVNTEGDVHYWGVWHGQEPFEAFQETENIGRFMSEYGFQSVPEMSSVKKFTLPEDWDIHSKVMLTHQKHRIGYPVIDKYINWYYRFPKDFEAYLYVSQVLQSYGVGMAIEAHRRAIPLCMGTLYWQLNDCYPVASWSGVDYYDKWKALQYRVRTVYKEILVSPVVEEDELQVYVVSDALEPVSATLSLELYDFTGELLKKKDKKIEISPNTSQVYYTADKNEFLDGRAGNKVILSAKLIGEEPLAENHFFFVYPKDLKLEKGEIDFSAERVENGYELTFNSDVFAKEVFLSTDDGRGFFTNNFFDLIPGQPVTAVFITDKEMADIKEIIKVYSLVDSY